jgi:hypothetical protein
MRISHTHKFVFIAPPKTASSSVRRSLNSVSDVQSNGSPGSNLYYHVKPEKLKKYFEDKNWNWDEYFKFAFVRNPWSRLVSQWQYRLRIAGKPNAEWETFGKNSIKFINKHKSFDNYIRNIRPFNFMCYSWIYNKSGEQLVDFIGKFENLQQDYDTVCDKIGIPRKKLPHKNKSTPKHYSEYYDDETKQIVAKKFKKDIEYFEYEFGGGV